MALKKSDSCPSDTSLIDGLGTLLCTVLILGRRVTQQPPSGFTHGIKKKGHSLSEREREVLNLPKWNWYRSFLHRFHSPNLVTWPNLI